MQGFAGLMGLTGFADMPPVRAGMPISDLAAALNAAFGIAVALYQRALDGKGQRIETSLLEGQVSWLSYYLVGYFADGTVAPRMGSSHPSLAPYRAYRAKDEDFVLAVGNDGLWRRLCGAIEFPEWADDPRFVTNVERIANRETLDALLQRVFERRTADEWIERLSQAGVPCGPINTVDRIAAEPQVWHREMIRDVPHPNIPDLKLGGLPVKLSRTPGSIQSPPPLLGEHTEQILLSLDYSLADIAELRSQGVVA
jgi:crotonobetainyl-CoA:carnitine CoA-transferase CaiB-like acyl-CoA transferase